MGRAKVATKVHCAANNNDSSPVSLQKCANDLPCRRCLAREPSQQRAARNAPYLRVVLCCLIQTSKTSLDTQRLRRRLFSFFSRQCDTMKVLLSVDSALGFQGSLLHELCSQHAVSPNDVTIVMSSQVRSVSRHAAPAASNVFLAV